MRLSVFRDILSCASATYLDSTGAHGVLFLQGGGNATIDHQDVAIYKA